MVRNYKLTEEMLARIPKGMTAEDFHVVYPFQNDNPVMLPYDKRKYLDCISPPYNSKCFDTPYTVDCPLQALEMLRR